MRRTSPARAAALLVALGALAHASPAHAFLFVSKSKDASSDGATVAALHEGKDTVLAIRTRVKGKLGDAAILLAVPPGTEEKTLAEGTLRPLEGVAAPHVVEYWEADPCVLHSDITPSPAPGSGDDADAPSAESGKDSRPESSKSDEKKTPSTGSAYVFAPVSGASGKEALESLKKDGYVVSDKLEPILQGYLDGGSTLVLAKLENATAIDGALPSLSLRFSSDSFTLPTRLFSGGAKSRDLDIFVLASGQRYQAAGSPNFAIPTNLEVVSGTKPKLKSFYAALVDKVLDKESGAVITEYAWGAAACELCTSPLTDAHFLALGIGELPAARAGRQREVVVDSTDVSSELGGPASLHEQLDACFNAEPPDSSGGEVKVEVQVAGGVVSAKASSSPPAAADGTSPPPASASLLKCSEKAVAAAKLDKAGSLTVDYLPLSRAYSSSLVLTKLHARFNGLPAKDLILEGSGAIEGGREIGADGKPDDKVTAAPNGNNFQARYTVRHAWKGPVKCTSPERGVWGGAPPGTKKSSDAVSGNSVASYLAKGGLDVASFAMSFPAAPPPPVPTPPRESAAKPQPASSSAPAASGSPAPAPGSTGTAVAPPAPPDGACSCREGGSESPSVSVWLLSALGVLGWWNRRRLRG